jgi:hypothetical protein
MGSCFLSRGVRKRMAEMCEAERSEGQDGECAERPLNAEYKCVYFLLSCCLIITSFYLSEHLLSFDFFQKVSFFFCVNNGTTWILHCGQQCVNCCPFVPLGSVGAALQCNARSGETPQHVLDTEIFDCLCFS